MHKHSLFSTFSPTLISCLFSNGHSNRYEAIAHCDFICIFFWSLVMLSTFMDLLVICTSSLGKYLFISSALLKIGLCDFHYWVIGVLYIFSVLTPYQIGFVNLFSHSIGCLFILLIISFAAQYLFSLHSYLCIFAFVAFNFGIRSKNWLPRLMLRR